MQQQKNEDTKKKGVNKNGFTHFTIKLYFRSDVCVCEYASKGSKVIRWIEKKRKMESKENECEKCQSMRRCCMFKHLLRDNFSSIIYTIRWVRRQRFDDKNHLARTHVETETELKVRLFPLCFHFHSSKKKKNVYVKRLCGSNYMNQYVYSESFSHLNAKCCLLHLNA